MTPTNRAGLEEAAAIPPEGFDPAMAGDLPEPARRWLTHAIGPGVAPARSVELTMRGQIRLGRWRPFTARQVLAMPGGFVWAATARVAGLPVSGFDGYTHDTGQMSWRLCGVLPVMRGSGPDVTRSAAGRFAAEATVLLPTGFRTAAWSTASDENSAIAVWHIGDQDEKVRLDIGPDGRILGVAIQRWGNPGGKPYARYPFGVTVEAERTFDGITIPAVFRAGWWWGTDRQGDGEFFRAEVMAATFRTSATAIQPDDDGDRA